MGTEAKTRHVYRAVSSVVENSIFDTAAADGGQGDGHPSIRFGQGLTTVVPTRAVQETLRGLQRDDLLKDEENGAKFDPKSSSYGQLPHRDWNSFAVIYTMIFFNGYCFTAVVPRFPSTSRYWVQRPPSWVSSYRSTRSANL